MKKIITASLVAMMAVTAANADIASTTYVDSRTGNVANSTFVKTLETGKQNLSGAVDALAGKLSSGSLTIANGAVGTDQLAGDAVTSAKIDDGTIVDADIAANANIAQSKIAGLGDALGGKVDETVYDAHLTAQSGVDSVQNADIKALQDSIATGGDTTKAIEAAAEAAAGAQQTADDAAAAAAGAQQTADGAVSVNNQQGQAITSLQSDKLDKTTYSEDKTAQAAVDQKQNEDIGKLDQKIDDELEALQGGVTEELAGMNTAINAKVATAQGADNKDKAMITDGTGNVKPGQIVSGMIADGEVKTADIATDAVTTGKIKDGEVKEADIADDAVTTGKIKDGEVKTADIATDAVTTAKISDKNVTLGKLEDSVQTSLGKADTAVQRTQVGIAESFGISDACKQKDVICSLTVKGTGTGAVAQWEVVQP